VFVNQAAARLFGFNDPSSLLGRPIHQFIPQQFHGDVDQTLSELLQFGDITGGQLDIIRDDGQAIPVRATATEFTWAGRPAIQTIAREVSPETPN